MTSIVLPGLTAFTVNSVDGTIISGDGGQLQFDFTDKVTVNDITGLFKKGGKIGSSISNLTTSDSVINVDVMNKLTNSCGINISIPEVYIPNIEMPVLRAA